MRILGKWTFVLAPICLFAAFFSSAVLQNQRLMSVCIVLATAFLILALIGRAIEARRPDKKEDERHD